MGISESDFWNMTFAELNRAMSSKSRMRKLELQEKATMDYVLADLVGRSIGRLHSSSNKMPEIATVYPTLFDSEEIQKQKAEQLTQISALRFKQFADSFNKNLKGREQTK